MRWLHDLDALSALAAEAGPVADWARVQCIARGATTPLPLSSDPLVDAAVLALMPPDWEAWAAQRLREPAFIALLEHVIPLGVIPSQLDPWIVALRKCLRSPAGAACANALLLLGVGLEPDELRRVSKRQPAARTMPAWIASVDRAAGAQAAKGVDPSDAIALLLRTSAPRPDLQEHLVAVVRALGIGEGKGSLRRRQLGWVRAMATALAPPLGPLIEGSMEVDDWVIHGVLLSLELTGAPDLDRYRGGLFDPLAVAAARAAHADPLEIGVALHRGIPSEDPVPEPLALAAALRWDGWLGGTVDLASPLGLELAAWTPTEAVLEGLTQIGWSADPAYRAQVARALVGMGIPSVLPRVQELIRGCTPQQRASVETLVEAMFHTAL